MDKKAKKKVVKKVVKKKVVAKKKVAKKTASKSNNPQDVTTFDEMLQSHIHLYQYYNTMNKQLHEQALEINTMGHQVGFLRQENMELKALLHSLATRLKDSASNAPSDNWLEDDKDQAPDAPKRKRQHEQKKKTLPMHDDVIINCETCSSIHHMNMKKCPKCGYERKKK